MNKTNRGGALLMAAVVALAACGKRGEEGATLAEARSAGVAAADAVAPMAPAPVAAPEARVSMAKDLTATAPVEAPVRRYLAVRHTLQIFTDPQGVEAAWRAASEACAAAQCEVLAASLARNDDRWPMQGTLEARIAPEHLDAFLSRVTGLGTVGRHDKTAQDKTDEVIDTEAQITNMSAFRDNLRRMMSTPGAKLRELIEVERELARVQAQIDSLASRRKALASETDKTHVMLTFSERPTVLETGVWTPVHDAVVGAGHVFASSLAGIILFVVGALPATVLLLATAFAARALWRRRVAKAT